MTKQAGSLAGQAISNESSWLVITKTNKKIATKTRPARCFDFLNNKKHAALKVLNNKKHAALTASLVFIRLQKKTAGS